jgi:hypothetical protein
MNTLFLLFPLSLLADQWIREHVDAQAPHFGEALAVETRFVGDIVAGMRAAGLVAGEDFTVHVAA